MRQRSLRQEMSTEPPDVESRNVVRRALMALPSRQLKSPVTEDPDPAAVAPAAGAAAGTGGSSAARAAGRAVKSKTHTNTTIRAITLPSQAGGDSVPQSNPTEVDAPPPSAIPP